MQTSLSVRDVIAFVLWQDFDWFIMYLILQFVGFPLLSRLSQNRRFLTTGFSSIGLVELPISYKRSRYARENREGIWNIYQDTCSGNSACVVRCFLFWLQYKWCKNSQVKYLFILKYLHQNQSYGKSISGSLSHRISLHFIFT